MIDRHFDAKYINQVANDPCVRGGTKIDTLDTEADFTPVIDDLRNVLLAYDGGCFLLMHKGPGWFEVHTMALKHGRGETLRKRVKEMLEYVFDFAHGVKLTSMAFVDNPAAVKLAEEFMSLEREEDGIKYYTMSVEDYRSAQCQPSPLYP